LESMDNLLREDPIETINLSMSRKYSFTLDTFRDVYRTDLDILVDSYKVATATHQVYERVPLQRDLYIGLAGRFGKNQGALSLALLRRFIR